MAPTTRKDRARDALLRRSRGVPDDQRWNHNLHFHDELLAKVPAGARRALDVGCGDGVLTRKLAAVAGFAVGMDLDAEILEQARAETEQANAAYVRGDLLHHPFEPASFDVVVIVAALHHVDATTGLERLAELVAPGGVLGVIGLARSNLPRGLHYEVASVVMTRVHQRSKGLWESGAPIVWPPPDTYAETRATAQQVLPGSEFRRRVLWRYVLTWTKPAA